MRENFYLKNRMRLLRHDKRIGKISYFYDNVSSTNDFASKFIRKILNDGSMFVSDKQELGRGRRGRIWIGGSGNLMFSIVLRLKIENLSLISRASILSSYAVLMALELLGFSVLLKWPNDIMLVENKKKISGILIESSSCDNEVFVTIGVGLNVTNRFSCANNLNTEGFASLFKKEGFLCRDKILFLILDCLEYVLFDISSDFIFKLAINRINFDMKYHSREVKVVQNEKYLYGKVLKVNACGALDVKTLDGNLIKIFSGDIFFLNNAI